MMTGSTKRYLPWTRASTEILESKGISEESEI